MVLKLYVTTGIIDKVLISVILLFVFNSIFNMALIFQ